MVNTLWIDVEDLFQYVRKNPRPSGIQRLAFEMYRALQTEYDASGCIHFVRHDSLRNSFRVVAWAELEALFDSLTGSAASASANLPPPIRPHSPARQRMRELVHCLPESVRAGLIDAAQAQETALRAWMRLAGTTAASLGQAAAQLASRPKRKPDAAPAEALALANFDALAAAGDVLLVLGSPWSHPNYATLVSKYRARGLRFALLVYDLIPLRRPEWCARGLVRLFRAWFGSILPLCDQVFAISRATAADVDAYAREQGIALPAPVIAIPVGSGFSHSGAPVAAARTARLPEPGSYALIVSTIEARKNHLLLFRIWRRLLQELPREQVPTLVFAGRIGWLVEDLLQQIANTDYLDGKLRIMEDPGDAELLALYAGCQFTLFPSLYEGWGLPVTESLALGKPCFISCRTSLPEAGGTLARSFDPEDLPQAYAMIRAVIEDPADLARWEATVRREFRPVSWAETAAALLAGLDHRWQPAQLFTRPEPAATDPG